MILAVGSGNLAGDSCCCGPVGDLGESCVDVGAFRDCRWDVGESHVGDGAPRNCRRDFGERRGRCPGSAMGTIAGVPVD